MRSCQNDGLTTDRLRENTILVPVRVWPTICTGKNLAFMEMCMLLCWMLQRYHFSKAPEFAYEGWYGRIREWNNVPYTVIHFWSVYRSGIEFSNMIYFQS